MTWTVQSQSATGETSEPARFSNAGFEVFCSAIPLFVLAADEQPVTIRISGNLEDDGPAGLDGSWDPRTAGVQTGELSTDALRGKQS